jgi:hypothetical protein
MGLDTDTPALLLVAVEKQEARKAITIIMKKIHGPIAVIELFNNLRILFFCQHFENLDKKIKKNNSKTTTTKYSQGIQKKKQYIKLSTTPNRRQEH